MEIYKQAAQQKLRFNTTKGQLTPEQLYDLSLKELDALAVSLEEEHKTSGKKSFLVKTSAKDKIAKLRFDIALDVLNTKVEEEELASEKLEAKKHNEKILNVIADKEDDSLKGKSIKELEKMLK